MDRKGFLFTVTVFLVLMYILLTISVWVKGVETSERAFSEFYKESTVELAIEQITPAKMDNATYMIMSRNLARLNRHSIDYPVKDNPVDETKNIRSALEELLIDGSADTAYFKGAGGQINETEKTSIKAWASNLNASLLAIGVYISQLEVSGFEINQSDINLVNYSFDIKLELRDFTNTSAVSRTYEIENEIDITGLVDPALARETEDKPTVYRQFFFNKTLYPDHSAIQVEPISPSIYGGQGFLYGPFLLAEGTANGVPLYTEVAPSKRRNFILVGPYEKIIEAAFDGNEEGPITGKQFAGYIVTTGPNITSSDCGDEESKTLNPIKWSGSPQDDDCEVDFGKPFTSKPFMVAPGFDPTDAEVCPIGDGSGLMSRCALFVNTYLVDEVRDDPLKKTDDTGSEMYDVEDIRDFVMCGYYTHNPKAPSYLQRLLDSPYERSSAEFGIETFVIGNYANASVYDQKSRLDRELMNGSIEGIKIRGLPGCKNFNSCSDDPITGIFAASDEAASDYDLEDIACNGECDQ